MRLVIVFKRLIIGLLAALPVGTAGGYGKRLPVPTEFWRRIKGS